MCTELLNAMIKRFNLTKRQQSQIIIMNSLILIWEIYTFHYKTIKKQYNHFKVQ